MSDFNYEVERTDHYFFENFTVDGESVQDGTPTPDAPVDVQVVEPVDGVFGININGVVTPIDLQGNFIASFPDGTKDVLTVDSTGAVTLDKRVGVVDLGTLNWQYDSQNTRFFTVGLVSLIARGSSGWLKNLACSLYVASLGISGNGTMSEYATTGYVYIRNTAYTTAADFKTAMSGVLLYYELATPQTIDLGYIDVSNLKGIPEEIPLSIVSTLNPETRYSYINYPSYDVLNPYEDSNAPEYAYPPNHFGQEWETFDANNWNKAEMLNYTGQPESHAVYTVELCELMQSGAFNWSRPELDWSEAAYNAEQYERFCKYFESRFMFREISMLPPLQWFTALKRMLVYELMPKYKPLYEQIDGGLAPLGENEYYKRRHITSNYPETLLSGNSDYITTGDDEEFERVKVNNAAEALESYRNGFRSVDAALGDELEILFVSMYTSFVNAF